MIDAPRQKVWDVLLDFESYGEWNPFVRAQRLVDASGAPPASKEPAEGLYIDIGRVHIPPTFEEPGLMGKSTVYVQITVVDKEHYRVAWETAGWVPAWLLHSERWQTLEELPDGRTKYESLEVFKGPVAYLIKLLVGPGLIQGFQAMADTLKQRAEAS